MSAEPVARHAGPSDAVWLVLAVALPMAAAFIGAMSTVDLAYQVRAGGEILDSAAIPRIDTWTYTVPGTPWFDQQWGAQVVLALLERSGGWAFVALARGVLTGLAIGLTLATARALGAPARTASLAALAAFAVAAPALAMRPQLFGVAAFALVLWLTVGGLRQPARLWFVPLVVLAWANLHGSFFLGPVVVAAAWLGAFGDARAARRPLLAVGLVSLAATVVTPFGPTVWSYVVGLSSDPVVSGMVSEWRATSIRTVPGLLFLGSALVVVGVLLRRRRPVGPATLLWLGGLFLVGAWAERGVVWWALGAAPIVAWLLTPIPDTASDATSSETPTGGPTPLPDRLLIGALGVVLALALPFWRPATEGPLPLLADAPVDVSEALAGTLQPDDHVFASQRWGSWLEYANPTLRVGVDSRIELFPAGTWADHQAVLAGRPDWAEILDRWEVDAIAVIPGEAEGLAESLVGDPAWRPALEDQGAAVYVRSTAATLP